MSKKVHTIAQALCRITNEAEMEKFLAELLTEKECHDVSLRWELMRRLYIGETQRSIVSDLGLSLCKVTRGNKIIKNDDSVTSRLLKESR